jgi:hypothetical protein
MNRPDAKGSVGHATTIEALQKALDRSYHQLVEAAKADWHRLFGDDHQSGAPITIRITPEEVSDELAGMPRAGFASARKKSGRRRI